MNKLTPVQPLTEKSHSLDDASKTPSKVDLLPLATFLATRMYPPRREGEYVSRACVERLAADARASRLVLVRAPAGYGKTTALSECYWSLKKANGTVAWLNLTDFAGSFFEFFRYLLKALSLSIPGHVPLIEQWRNGWFEAPSIEVMVSSICNEIAAYSDQVYFFIDDFDAVLHSDIEIFVQQLLRDAPPNFHLILSCRSIPSFGLGRLRIQGLLAEIGVEQLRFTEEDARQFLSNIAGLEVGKELLASLLDKIEGWPAGLQLVSVLLNHSDDVQQRLEAFNGEIQEVGEFLAEDVFEKLDPDLVDFLLKTSVLKRLSVPLCNAVTGRTDSRSVLDELERRSLFIYSLDSHNKWYRYQSLFSEFLFRNLKERHPELVAELHIKASNWYVSDRLVVPGIHHALFAEDFHLAANILDSQAEFLLSSGLPDTLYTFITRLPEEVLYVHPNLRMWQAIYLICHRKFPEAEPILIDVEKYLDEESLRNTYCDSTLNSLRDTLLQAKFTLAQWIDDMPRLERLCIDVLADSVINDPATIGSLHSSLLHAQREQYRLDEVELRGALARKYVGESQQPIPSIVIDSILGLTYVQRGEFDEAELCYRRGLALCNSVVDKNTGMRAGMSALLADLLLERMSFDEIKPLFELGSVVVNGIGFVDTLIASFVGQSRLANFKGDYDQADRLLKEGIDCAIGNSLERLRWCCVDERIRQHMQRGDTWGALRVSADAGLPESDEQLYPTGEFTTTREAKAMAWARVALVDGRPKDALKLLKRWVGFVERQRAIKSFVKLSILLAQVYQALGEVRSAVRVLKDIMPHIAKNGMVFCLAEEGPALRALIIQACEVDNTEFSGADQFVENLKNALSQDSQVSRGSDVMPVVDLDDQAISQYEPLNAKEIEILKLVSRSMLNKEIANRLGLTEGTVKWYFQQIYDKFGVRRRFAALEKARALGYL